MQHVQGLRSPGLQALRPAPRAPAGGRQPASRRGACVVRASASEELEGWQVQKLQQALLAGRRQVQVEKLCKELNLPRGTVLQWLKTAPPPDRTQQSLLEARAAAEQAQRERQAVLQQPSVWQAAEPAAAAQRGGGGGPGQEGGQPAWKSYSRRKKLGKQAEATLEMIYARTQLKNSPSTLLQWPSDDAVAGMWDLHRMPRDKVVEWFQQRRRQDQRRRGAGGSGGGRSGAAQQATTDWDAEWDQEK